MNKLQFLKKAKKDLQKIPAEEYNQNMDGDNCFCLFGHQVFPDAFDKTGLTDHEGWYLASLTDSIKIHANKLKLPSYDGVTKTDALKRFDALIKKLS